MKNNIWISSSFFSKNNIDEIIIEMKKINFTKLELTAGIEREPNIENKLLNYEQEGFEFLIHNYFPKPKQEFVINLASTNLKNINRTLDHCVDSIKLASKLNNKTYSVHSGFAFEMDINLIGNMTKQSEYIEENKFEIEIAFEQMVINSNKILKIADELGVEIIFENNMIPNHNFRNIESVPYFLVEPVGIKNFFNEIEFKNCGLLLDVAHAKIVSDILGLDPHSFFNLENIKYIQLSDPEGFQDSSKIFNENSWFYNEISKYSPDCYILEIKESNKSKLDELVNKINNI